VNHFYIRFLTVTAFYALQGNASNKTRFWSGANRVSVFLTSLPLESKKTPLSAPQQDAPPPEFNQ